MPIPQPTENTTGWVGSESGICLDCHDGTVPVGAFDGSSNESQEMLDGVLGTDLRVHHPVSFAYPADHDPNDPDDTWNLNPSTGGTGPNDRGNPLAAGLFVRVGDQLIIECVTCHDQHTHYQANNPDNVQYHGSYRWGHFVRMNGICFFCHPRYQDDIDANRKVGIGSRDKPLKTADNGHHMPHRQDPFGLTTGPLDADGDPLGYYDAANKEMVNNQEFACVQCHDIDGEGTYGHGHNSACVECHYNWTPDPIDSPYPDESTFGHHGLGSSRWNPLGNATDANGERNP